MIRWLRGWLTPKCECGADLVPIGHDWFCINHPKKKEA